MTSLENGDYGHAQRALAHTIFLSKVHIDEQGKITEDGQKWLEELLQTFGYNPALVDKLRPEYRKFASEIIKSHDGETHQPSLFRDVPAETLLDNYPDEFIEG